MGMIGFDNWWLEATLLLGCLVLYLLYRFKRKLDYFPDRGFPTLPFWKTVKFTVGIMTFRQSIQEFVDEIYKHFGDEKICGYYQLGGNVLLVKDPDLLNKILIKDFSYFHDHGLEVDTEVNPLEGHLFNMNGAQWRALRNKLTPTFTTGKLRGMLPQMSACSDNLVEAFRQMKSGEDVLIHDLLSRFAIDVIGSCAFGFDAGAIKNPDCEFKRIANKIFRPGKILILKALLKVLFPKQALRLKIKTMDDEVTRFFFDITRQAFEHRMKTGQKRNDFIDLLLQLKLKGSVDCDPKELTDEDLDVSPGVTGTNSDEEPVKLVLTDGVLAAQSFVFLIAGWINVASVIDFTLYFLAKHPDAQEKARLELRRAKEKYGGETTYEALREMVFLEACISESMRLFSQALILLHSCTKSYTLDDGRVIEKGTAIVVPICSLHRDPAYFYDADEFRPERFMPDHQVPSNVYMPFGDGPRICIARRFVILEVKHVLSKLLENFKFASSPKTKEPVKLSPRFMFFEAEGGLWLRLENLQEDKKTS